MARSYTSINHSALSSDTLAEANDITQGLFWRLLCVSDDWGRFPNSPAKLKRMMQDFNHTEEQIAEAVKHFVDHGSVSVYEVADMSICEWNKWDEYQTMRWKNEAALPNRAGEFEPSTNPLSDRPSKKQSKTNHIITNHIKADDGASVATKATTKDKPKQTHKFNPVAKWCELWKDTFSDKFIIVPANAKHINDAFKALKSDEADFDRYLHNFFSDVWVQTNRPSPDYFYRNISKYAKPAGIKQPIRRYEN